MKLNKEQLKKAISILIGMNIKGYIDDIEFDEFINSFNEYWVAITDGTEAYIDFRDYDDSPSIYLPQLIKMALQLENAKIDYNIGAAIANNEFLFCIDSSDYYSIELLENLIKYNKTIVTESENKEECYWMNTQSNDGCTVSIYLLADTVTVYHLLLEKLHDTSEYFPAFNPYESFICITSDSSLTAKYAEELADSFLFELNSTFGMQFTRKIRPQMEIIEKQSQIENANIQKYNLNDYQMLPIVTGRGIHEVIKIYNKAIETEDVSYKILNYARVIEYVSPTIARQELIGNVLAELSLKDSQNINADFVLLLGENYRKYDMMKDKELCRAAISVVDYKCIADNVPEYIKRWADWDDPQKRKEVVIRIADSITATRNEIAHAKANYQQCGLECPPKYQDEFAVMMQKIAEFLFRWYSQQPEKLRICD
jgi:hypothetical protein